jgi:hypothetical protein
LLIVSVTVLAMWAKRTITPEGIKRALFGRQAPNCARLNSGSW